MIGQRVEVEVDCFNNHLFGHFTNLGKSRFVMNSANDLTVDGIFMCC